MTPEIARAHRDERELCAQEAEAAGSPEATERIRARTGLDHHIGGLSDQEVLALLRKAQRDVEGMKALLRRHGFDVDAAIVEEMVSELLEKVNLS